MTLVVGTVKRLPGDRAGPRGGRPGGVLHLHTATFASPRAKRDDNNPVVHSAHALRILLSSAITSYDFAKFGSETAFSRYA